MKGEGRIEEGKVGKGKGDAARNKSKCMLRRGTLK